MTFEVEITEPSHLAGITAAREAYNETAAEDEQIETDAAYVQFVMSRAAESYARQHST